MIENKKMFNIFEQYDEYIGFSRKNKEWNTFTHFVRFLKSSKNKNNTELQQVLTDISLFINSEPIEMEFPHNTTKLHNQIIYHAIWYAFRRHEIFYNYTDYSCMKDFYYSNSLLKYLLKNICINKITEKDFKFLLSFIDSMKKTNEDELFDDDIKYYTKDKTFRALQKKYPLSLS